MTPPTYYESALEVDDHNQTAVRVRALTDGAVAVSVWSEDRSIGFRLKPAEAEALSVKLLCAVEAIRRAAP